MTMLKVRNLKTHFYIRNTVVRAVDSIDLDIGQKSGMVEAIKKLRRIKGIGSVKLTQRDIVRHRLVQNIVRAYRKETKAER